MAQAHTLDWTNPTQRVDGTPYVQADNAGYEIQIDGASAVSIPLAWGTSFDLTTLAVWPTLKPGTHSVGLAVVDTGGLTSAFTTATFPLFSTSPPLAATGVAVV